MYQAVLFDAYVDKTTEVGDIVYNARQYHTFFQIVDGTHILVKFKYLDLLAGITPRLVEFLHDIR